MRLLMPTRDDILNLCKEKMKFYNQCKCAFLLHQAVDLATIANRKQILWTNLYNKTISEPVDYWKNLSIVHKMVIMSELETK